MVEELNPIEIWAMEIELSDNFKNFNSMDFLRRLDNNEVSDKEMLRFYYMYYQNGKMNKEKEKLNKK